MQKTQMVFKMEQALILSTTIIIAISFSNVCCAPVEPQTYHIPASDPYVMELALRATREVQKRESDEKQVIFLNTEKAEATIDNNGRSYEIRFIAGITNCYFGEKCNEWNVEDKTLYLASVFIPENQHNTEFDINVVPLKHIDWDGEASGYGCKALSCGIQ
ncbi:unnamed protein product [Bursaphelenchus okinawaensis]|uniref:Cystatin domain-containing protein n=1 Tax=Bursaphelenchus okinawaensis TaxID=465554 RepID=A0A811KN23_9BILA|nr:unnamed protein product [Bursaphelenchus okinawaensis]CAG9108547.1 unnamed protein product [Bursaphelenchus okinawaensis]